MLTCEHAMLVRCSFGATMCLCGDILPSGFRSDSKRKTLAASYCTDSLPLSLAVHGARMIMRRGMSACWNIKGMKHLIAIQSSDSFQILFSLVGILRFYKSHKSF